MQYKINRYMRTLQNIAYLNLTKTKGKTRHTTRDVAHILILMLSSLN